MGQVLPLLQRRIRTHKGVADNWGCFVSKERTRRAGIDIKKDLVAAARNGLLDSQFICKIADFGLGRDIGATDADEDDAKEYCTSHGSTFPVRWTAPEAIETMKFSTATDIWSYAVVQTKKKNKFKSLES